MPVVEVHLSNVDEREDWRQTLGDRGRRHLPRDRQGAGGLPRRAPVPGGGGSDDRIDRLRASLEEPLLVTNGVNVRYLVGFSSSNAALFVEPERVRLFSDFRYAEAARAVEGVEFVETKRSLVAALAELLEGPVGFEADAVSYSSWEVLRAGGLELVPRRGLVETLRAVKDEASWTRSAAPARSRARPTRASPRSASSAAPSASSRGGWTSSSTSSAPTRRPSRRSSPRARTPPSRTHGRPTARSRPARRS